MSEERDRALEAAWRAASREEPPPSLDAAVRAEARRAVGAGPEEARRRRLRQLRYPFAAAATVALLAFGIAQMTPPDEVVPGGTSDQAPAPRARGAEKPAPPSASSAPISPALPPASPASPSASPAPALAPQPSVALQPPQSSAMEPQRKNESLRKESGERFASAPRQIESAAAPRSPPEARPPPSDAATKKLAPSAPAAAADSAPRGIAENADRSEPFPATPGAAGTAPLANEPRRAAAPQPATPLAEARRDAGAPAPQAEAPAATAVGQVRNRTAAAQVSDLDELKAKDAGVESVAAWIARIRELRASGRVDAAAVELAKFRSTFGERADALLPTDLRAIAPARP